MLTLTGYDVHTQLYESEHSRIYRAIREADVCPVILKCLNHDQPSPEQRARFQWEYDLTRRVIAETVIHAYALECSGQTLVMVLDDLGATSLHQLRRERVLHLSEVLAIAVNVAAALNAVHAAGLIHKDVNPSNLIYNSTTGQLQLIDFGIAARLDMKIQPPGNPEMVEGTWPYIAPEQTGRMNRVIDNRADLYAFGVTLYELLTGHLPFDSRDALQLIYDHLATAPVPPCQVNPDIPAILSDLILKLLAKNADERYQSAHGVQVDLEICLAQLRAPGSAGILPARKIAESPSLPLDTLLNFLESSEASSGQYEIPAFPLAQSDVSERFRLPQKLYGREQELASLLAAFERVSNTGAPEVALVSGAAGTGKSSLVSELYRPLTKTGGLLLNGKFDQFQRNVPYDAIRQVLDEFVNLLLTEPETVLHQWRDRLTDALGNVGQVILDIAPRLELVIGQQPAVAAVGPQETQNRFQFVLQNVVTAIAQPDHPLVIFLDDLQWADAASVHMLNAVLTDPQLRHVLLILAYRDTEIQPGHSLSAFLTDLQQADIPMIALPVANLDSIQINALLSETFACEPMQTQPLSELLAAQTGGNAFFTRQLLSAWHDAELIWFDDTQRRWLWNLELIRLRDISADVIAVMQQKLHRLPMATQTVLGLAACIGNTFDVTLLSMISDETIKNLFADLEPAIQAQVILPFDAQYQYAAVEPKRGQFRFLHDRVQQGAYDGIGGDRKSAVHVQIGKLLLANTPADQQEEHLFTIVNHLNAGRTLLEQSEERLSLAELNLRAGLKAKASAAYQLTFKYVTIGIELLPETCWNTHYHLTFALYREHYEGAYLVADIELAECLFTLILARAHSLLDQAEIYTIAITQLPIMHQDQKAIELGRIALRLFGMDLPQDNFEATLGNELQIISLNLGGRTVADLQALPDMTNPNQKAVVRIFMNLLTPAFTINPELFSVIAVKTINIVLQYGVTPDIPQAFAVYGGLVGALTGNYQKAFEFGQLALRLSEQAANPAQQCRTCHSVTILTYPWRRPLRAGAALARQGIEYGLQSGEIVYTEYCFSVEILALLTGGAELSQIKQNFDEMHHFAQNFKHHGFIEALLPTQQLLLNLQGHTSSQYVFDDQFFQEANFLEQYQYSPVACCQFHIYKLQALYLYEQYADALRMAEEASTLLASVATIVVITEYNFYLSLTLCALYPTDSLPGQQQYRGQLIANQQRMQLWAENCPENFRHKFLLVEAEIARIEGRNWEAVENYRQAIAEARRNEFLQNEAIGHELLAKFWLAHGDMLLAKTYLTEAYAGYQRWGATGKLKTLEEKYPQFFNQPVSAAPAAKFSPEPVMPGTTAASVNVRTETFGAHGSVLDVTTLLKASQILAQEVRVDRLLRQIMGLMLENAGAERGALLLKENAVWEIQAHGSRAHGIQVLQRLPLDAVPDQPERVLCRRIVDYVARTGESLVLADAGQDRRFSRDAYLQQYQVKSVLCQPLLNQGQMVGILYLENNLTTGAFTPDRLELLSILSSRAAISLENARLYTELSELNRRLEERVVERTQALEQSNRALQAAQAASEAANLAKSAFLAHISHELRTPLNAILGYTQLLRRDQALTEKHQDAVATIHRSGEHLLLLINDLLDVSRIEAHKLELHPTPFPLPVFIKNLVETVRMRTEQKALRVVAECAPDLPATVLADERRLRQILLNLLNNAIKFTEHGHVALKILDLRFEISDGDALQSQISNPSDCLWTGQNHQIRFEISDTGDGIPPEHLPHIFDAFYQVDQYAAQEGSGLGLTISQQLVRLMGSELHIKSTVGQGCVFWFDLTLPVVTAELSDQTSLTRPLRGYAGGCRKILLVDDNAENRGFLRDLLRPLGFDLQEAANGRDALAITRNWQPHAILMDLLMSGMDGFETTRRIRAEELNTDNLQSKIFNLQSKIPIIAISASVAESVHEESLTAGCDDFLAKPVGVAALLECLRQHLRLEWIYATAAASGTAPPASAPLAIPPSDVLRQLIRLANSGYVNDLEDLLADLARNHVGYLPFVAHMTSLAKNLQIQQIVEELELYLSGYKNNA